MRDRRDALARDLDCLRMGEMPAVEALLEAFAAPSLGKAPWCGCCFNVAADMVRLGTAVPQRIAKEVDGVRFLRILAGSWAGFNLNIVGIVPVLRQTLLRKSSSMRRRSGLVEPEKRMLVLY